MRLPRCGFVVGKGSTLEAAILMLDMLTDALREGGWRPQGELQELEPQVNKEGGIDRVVCRVVVQDKVGRGW